MWVLTDGQIESVRRMVDGTPSADPVDPSLEAALRSEAAQLENLRVNGQVVSSAHRIVFACDN
jgi:hypothetical protein